MRSPNPHEEGRCHAPSHLPGRKPLLASRPDRWTRASLVNRSGRSNCFGHLVDGLRLHLRGIVDPLTGGTAATPASCSPAGVILFRSGKNRLPIPKAATPDLVTLRPRISSIEAPRPARALAAERGRQLRRPYVNVADGGSPRRSSALIPRSSTPLGCCQAGRLADLNAKVYLVKDAKVLV
jgi:hypothetical protein